MVKENIHDHSNATHVTLSSIALLQERFKQLEKMKELRQEKEHLKMLSELSQKNTTPLEITPHEPVQELRPHCQLSLSLRPDSQSQWIKYEDPRGTVMDQGPSRNPAKSCFADDDAHIDTSLRL
ncbi:hypothetical protein PHJA_002125000 [Phtheirospermum japonicum]|uniref:Uncharacterized protein n=1 Tax=Phtheirospermum japonicum TaxID=374723 RepID=A0A830CLG2_9LAMI|nr:hypothetical protein PHJA_002125000 [Phtheirospermum japonicum]